MKTTNRREFLYYAFAAVYGGQQTLRNETSEEVKAQRAKNGNWVDTFNRMAAPVIAVGGTLLAVNHIFRPK